jgi:WD40 repeat protein
MKRNIYVGLSVFALAAILGTGSVLVKSKKAVVHAASVMAPKFEVDSLWPKPLPNHWGIGDVIGLSMDSHDNVWIVHRPQTMDANESLHTRDLSDCCTAAPDVLEFDQAGNLIRHWGKAEGHDWPSSNHGITIDSKGNVWLGANGAAQPGPPAGSAEQFAKRTPGGEGGGEKGVYHDSFILKMSQDGQFLGEIGHANGSKGSLDTENVRGVATIRFLPTGELVAADGYGNHRVSVWDPDTFKFKRMWGAYGHTPSDDPMPHFNPQSPQFGNPVHCAEPTIDGFIYVCDRTNDRIQIFKPDGTYVKEVYIQTDTKAQGSVWEIAFSKDPQQKFMYVSDGANEKIHVFDRQSMKELYSFGTGGRQPGEFDAVHSIVTDSKGNIFTTETYHGRVQKFIYKGLAPVSELQDGSDWPR